jgi:hypothetical protein
MDYESLANVSLNMIDDAGASITLRRVTEGTYDPTTGTRTGNTTTDTTVKAVATGYKAFQIDGEIIKRDDRLFFVAAKDLSAPQNSDIIIQGSDQFKIVNVETVNPAGTAILYKIQARK